LSTKQDFLNRYPEFDPIDNDDYFNSVLAQSQRQVTQKVWGATYNDGLFALIAHYLELGKKDRAGRAGHIVEERLGPAARRYSERSSNSSSYGDTSYGQVFESLKNSLATRIFFR
jgi:hypothetical protein